MGVVVPVHNEESLLDGALTSLEAALRALHQWPLDVGVAVILDSCTDQSSHIVDEWIRRLRRQRDPILAMSLACAEKNVGIARGLGCAVLLHAWHRIDVANIWLATTDSDSRVPREWLSAQLVEHERGADLWTGRVAVTDWTSYRRETVEHWSAQYEAETSPIHGTNMGFNAASYLAVGGFPRLPLGEDRELCRLMAANNTPACHDSYVRVVTSARRQSRAPHGFAHVLELLDARNASVNVLPGSMAAS